MNEDVWSQLTSKIDKNLNANEHKRKRPSTNDTDKPQQKRQRNSEGGAPKKLSKEEQDALLAEIKALGGDEEDFKLINEVDSSDDEYAEGSTKPISKGLKDEIAAFSKELGLADYVPSEPSVDGNAEKEEGDNDDDEEAGQDQDGESASEAENIAGKIPGLVRGYWLLACLTHNLVN